MKLKVSFFFILMLGALIFSHSYLSLSALLAATLHELGHIIAAKICSVPMGELKLGIFGASLKPSFSLSSYPKEIFLAAAGPFVNLLTFLIFSNQMESQNEFVRMFLVSSLFLGVLNLLPIEDLDGGRILKCVLLFKLSPQPAEALCKVLSFLVVFSLWALSVYLLLRLSASLSLFVFSLALFSKIFLKGNL